MTKWHTIPAKFTSEEKRILDKLRDKYGLSHNQSLKRGVEILARLIAMSEYFVTTDSKAIKKISKINKRYSKIIEAEAQEVLKKIPLKEQEEQYKQLEEGVAKIWSKADNIFVKNRKRGRRSLKRKRGRPADTGKTS